MAFGHQHHQRHADQNFVGDGVEHPAEIAAGVEFARYEPVQRVAQARQAKDGKSHQPRRVAGKPKGNGEHRNQGDAKDGQDVWQCEHESSLLLPAAGMEEVVNLFGQFV